MGLTHRNSALIAKRCQYQMSLMGPITSFWGDADDFRSTPVNGHLQSRSACLKGANSRHNFTPKRSHAARDCIYSEEPKDDPRDAEPIAGASVTTQVYEPRYLRFAAFPSQNLSHHRPPDCLHEATHLSMADAFGVEVL